MRTVPKDLETVPPHPHQELPHQALRRPLEHPVLNLHLHRPPVAIVLYQMHELLVGKRQLRTAFRGRQCYAETTEGSSVVVL